MRPLGRRVLVAGLAYVATLAVVCVVAFFVVIVIAGPHAGLVPQVLEPAVIALGWLAVLVLPVLASRAAWRRSGGGP